MAVLDRTRKISEYNQDGHLSYKKFFKIFAFFLFNPDFIGIVRADSFGGAAGGGAPRRSKRAAKRRNNILKFDIFCKRPTE
jgi:hypothetical protein